MGVSATHIDWTMVPYVRKSFRKHLKSYLTSVEDYTKEAAEQIISFWEKNNGEITLNSEEELKKMFPEKMVKYAKKELEKETYQAVEGLYHNLKFGA